MIGSRWGMWMAVGGWLVGLAAPVRAAGARLAPTFLVVGSETVVASAVATEAPWKADPTGRSDAAAGIQAALDAVAAAGGGVVFLPAGRYRLDGPLKIGYATTLEGAGGDPDRALAARRTVLLAAGATFDRPLLDVTASEGALIGLGIWYPNQSAEDPVAYPFTIQASGATLRDVALLNAYNGVNLQAANTCIVDHLVGTVLNVGLAAPHSTEFSWMRDVRFANRYWQQAAADFAGAPRSAGAAAALDRFTHQYLVGLELGRIDGMVVDGFHADDARLPVGVKKDPEENQHRVFGFGGVVHDFPGRREDFQWDPWYYGMHYVDMDNVPEARTLADHPAQTAGPTPTPGPTPTLAPASTPGPARRDLASFYDVTRAPYSAAGDGKADDTTALQSALDAAGKAGGGTVYLPQGDYRVTRPLMVPAGVELRGPLGRGKARAFRNTCSIAADFGADTDHPETDPALLTLEDHAGVRGIEIVYPDQPFDAARLHPYPYAIRGHGAGVWVVDVLLVNADRGIDLGSARCDDHLVRGVWGTALGNGIRVGGGSRGGRLEQIAFSYGPWLESWLLTAADRNPALVQGIVAYWRQNNVQYVFGDCDGETGWGLVGFDPAVHLSFQAENGRACRNATFRMSLFDVANRAILDLNAGQNLRFVGLWGTGGGGGGATNWLEVGPGFQGPLEVYGKTIQPTFWKHPAEFRPEQVRFYDEASLTDGRPATASASAAGRGPELAVDRDFRTYWQAPAGSWLQVDLGRVEMVNRFGIESAGYGMDRKLNTLEADLYLSEDGVHFQRMPRLYTNGATWADRPILPTPARYARLVVTNPGADGVIRVNTFQVFGEAVE